MTTKLWKQLAKLGEVRQADLDGDGDGDGIPAGAWCERDHDGKFTGQITYTTIPWYIKLLVGGVAAFVRTLYVYLFAHESRHVVEDKDNDGLHHPWWHFCVLVGHRLRLWPGHVPRDAIRAGERLLAAVDGEVVEA